MKKKIKNCSTEKHKEIDSNYYCKDCRIYMCNKCYFYHSELFKNHHIKNENINLENKFIGLCLEKDHLNELKYFCKNHNQLCCVSCISKIKDNEIGQHKDCEIYHIEDIKVEKEKELNANIKILKEFSNNIDSLTKELEKIFDKINNDKEAIEGKIEKAFTKIRNLLNEIEDELFAYLKNEFDNLYCNKIEIKECKTFKNEIKKNLEIANLINEKKNYKLNEFINDCIIIENKTKELNRKNEIIEKCKYNYNNIKFKFELEENDINNIMQSIKLLCKKKFHNTLQYSNDTKELTNITDFTKYFNHISSLMSKYNNFILFIAAKDECTCALNLNMMAQLNKMGIRSNLIYKYRYSFYAIKGPNIDKEELSPIKISTQGKIIKNGEISYSISSAGFETGNIASIIINGHEYAKNWRGLNVVVYDFSLHRVIDTIVFDTWENGKVGHR